MKVELFDLVIATLSRNVQTASMYQNILQRSLHQRVPNFSVSHVNMGRGTSWKLEVRRTIGGLSTMNQKASAVHADPIQSWSQSTSTSSRGPIVENVPQDLKGTKANQLEEVHEWPMLPKEQDGFSQVNIFVQQSQTVSRLSVNWPGRKKLIAELISHF